MAALNRFLIIVIAILAIGAAVLSYLLFERRTEFRDRAALLADTTVDMVQALDKDSDTHVARKVTFSPADPVAKLKESGTMSWADYHSDRINEYSTFKKNLQEAASLAGKINEQRNYLAETIAQIGFDLQMPVEAFSTEDLKKAAEKTFYNDACSQVVSLAKASNSRADDMIRSLISAASAIGHSMEDSMFRSRDTEMDETGKTVMGSFRHRGQLEEFNKAVVELNTRCTDYADAIVRAISTVDEFQWQTDRDLVKSKRGYDRGLISLGNDASEINVELKRSKERKAMVERLNIDLNAAKEDLAKTRTERDELQTKVADLNLVRAQLEEELLRWRGVRGPGGNKNFDLDPNLKGHVVQVNKDWNFVILDLGENDVYETLPLLVSRQDKYMGKVFVTKVAKNISVAEIDPKLLQADLQEGDIVILPEGY